MRSRQDHGLALLAAVVWGAVAVVLFARPAYACATILAGERTAADIAWPWILYGGGFAVGLLGIAVAWREQIVGKHAAISLAVFIAVTAFLMTTDACATPPENVLHGAWLVAVIGGFVQVVRFVLVRYIRFLRRRWSVAPDV